MQVFFEGIDRVGKSTIQKLFNKKTNYEYLTFDRGILSYLAYGFMNKRILRLRPLELKYYVPGSIIVYIKISEKTLSDRVKNTSHPKINYRDHVSAFEYYLEKLRKLGFKILEYTNNDDTYLEELIERIARDVEEVELSCLET